MKTATVPNDPHTIALMKVSAELSVVLEAYENECISSLNARVETSVDKAISKMADPTQVPNVAKIIRDLVADVMTETATHIKIHERAMGMTAEQAPAENALRAVKVFEATTKQYWDAVSK